MCLNSIFKIQSKRQRRYSQKNKPFLLTLEKSKLSFCRGCFFSLSKSPITISPKNREQERKAEHNIFILSREITTNDHISFLAGNSSIKKRAGGNCNQFRYLQIDPIQWLDTCIILDLQYLPAL